jgi:hypothetical protein
MCHEWWTRHQRRRDESFDEELRYLFDESVRPDPKAPVVVHDQDEQPADPDRPPVEVGSSA